MLDLALKASGLVPAKGVHRQGLLSDIGASYIANDLVASLDGHGQGGRPGRALSPTDARKDRTLASGAEKRILLETYYLPGDLEPEIETFVADDTHRSYHEGIYNLTPADVSFGRGQTILIETERIER